MKHKSIFAALTAFLTILQFAAVPAAAALGDTDASGAVNASDAAQVLIAAAEYGAQGTAPDETALALYDVNGDGLVNASDAQVILAYAAYTGAGGRLTFDSYLTADIRTVDAVFLGVKDWGKSQTTFANADSFQYRFLVDDAEQLYTIDNSEVNEAGERTYPIQNLLKVQYHYAITVENGQIVSAQETETGLPTYTPPISGTPGVMTLRNFLQTAMEPVGTTLYMFGGGWNWQDDGGGWASRKIGVQPDWVRFWQEQDQNYTYRDNYGNTSNPTPTKSFYPYGGFNQYHYAGLDCSGYVSWAVYNTLHDIDDLPSYGGKSTQMARRYAGYGWGDWLHDYPKPTSGGEALCPGDIISKQGHVYLVIGTCPDGSVVIAHSTPSYSYAGQPGGGVQIGAVGTSASCQAYQLAKTYMERYYPGWCERYKITLQSTTYFDRPTADCGRFRWDTQNFLTDPEGLQSMNAADALACIFGET